MAEIEIILLLLVAVAALAPLARAVRVPYPILLVLGGLLLALLPFTPGIQLTPDLVLLLFLPPLVYSAAFNTSIRDFRQSLRPILSLAVGLVLATTAAVAVLLHAVFPDLGWPLAFAFGAIVSPPDAVAAAAVFRGLGVPRRVVTLLEGESLINDATALVIYRTALVATAVAFSPGETAGRFAIVAVGGVLVGLVVARLMAWLERRLNDPPVEITLSLLTPYAAYLPAESLGVSGVLAAVTAGLYLGWRAPHIWGFEARLRGRAVWDMVNFTLNGLVFILIGLQLSTILPTLAGRSIV
ncbi:MAG TPA: cation:proton antiporter, partial [Chloroflexia bacterium]|nr:cation:proton antiporter [Chloroflexia bacterium]